MNLFEDLDYTPSDVTGQKVTINISAEDTKALSAPRVLISLMAIDGEQREWQEAVFSPLGPDPFGKYTLKLEQVAGSFSQSELDTALNTRFSDHGVYLKDVGCVGDGVTNDTVAFNAALASGQANNKPVIGHPGATYLVDGLVITSGTVPVYIDMKGAKIKCSGANVPANGSLVYVENPHSIQASRFKIVDAQIDADKKVNHALKIHGSQECNYENLVLTNGLGDGLVLEGGPGFGIYSNNLANIESKYNNGRGVVLVTVNGGTATHNAVNNLLNVASQYNLLEGWYVNYATASALNCRSERNNGVGISIDNTRSFTWLCGYFENNHQNMAIASNDSTQDELALLTANSSGVTIFAPRDIGNIDDSAAIEAGNKNLIITRNTGSLSVDSLGNLKANTMTLGVAGSLAFGTAAFQSNAISAADVFRIFAAGKNNMQFNATTGTDEGYTQHRFDIGSSDVFRTLKPGAADSGVAGKRLVYVDN